MTAPAKRSIDPRYVKDLENTTLALKSRVDELMDLGPMPTRTREALTHLKILVHGLALAADPWGDGKPQEGGGGGTRRKFDQPYPHRTTNEGHANRVLAQVTADLEHVIRNGEWRWEGPPRNGDTKRRRRPECPSTPPCRNARGGTRRQGNGDVFCGGCGTPYPDTT